jgi:hypothetical protein
MKDPAFPSVADPVAMLISPLVPELVVPLENRRLPLTPLAPALTDRITTEPLVVDVPVTVLTLTVPPVNGVLVPADA